jgi:hypothetical protein
MPRRHNLEQPPRPDTIRPVPEILAGPFFPDLLPAARVERSQAPQKRPDMPWHRAIPEYPAGLAAETRLKARRGRQSRAGLQRAKKGHAAVTICARCLPAHGCTNECSPTLRQAGWVEPPAAEDAMSRSGDDAHGRGGIQSEPARRFLPGAPARHRPPPAGRNGARSGLRSLRHGLLRASFAVLTFAIGCVAAGSVAMAHHSVTMFDREHPIQLIGAVREFKFVNPTRPLSWRSSARMRRP